MFKVLHIAIDIMKSVGGTLNGKMNKDIDMTGLLKKSDNSINLHKIWYLEIVNKESP